MRWWFVVLAVVACKETSRPSFERAGENHTSPTSASGEATPKTVADASVFVAEPMDAAPPAKCTYGCLYLNDVALVEAQVRYAADCNRPWPYPEDDCYAYLVQMNCIYAANGLIFKQAEWKTRFESMAWYHPKASFTEADLKATGAANIVELRKRRAMCMAPKDAVTAGDRELVKNVFVELNDDTKSPKVTSGFVPDGRLAAAVKNKAVMDETLVRYVKKDAKRRTITVENLYEAVGAGRYIAGSSFDLTFDDRDHLIEAQ